VGTPPEGEPGERFCRRCGAPHDAGQEYCLECGQRLGPGTTLIDRLGNAWRERFAWYPGDWIWPVLFGLVIAVVGGVAAILVAGAHNGNATLVATHQGRVQEPVAPAVTATVALPTVPRGTPTVSGPPQTPTTPPPATTTPAPSGGLIVWPANREGWTVVLESVPLGAGRAFALSRARAALSAGLTEVGVLNSGRYSSLHPGYYVVFSGIYPSQSAANSAQSAAAAKGFAAAYTRQIVH